jgi:hypothetical protein
MCQGNLKRCASFGPLNRTRCSGISAGFVYPFVELKTGSAIASLVLLCMRARLEAFADASR